MNHVCLGCCNAIDDDADYHALCLTALFGESRLPAIDVEIAKLHTLALASVGRTTLSGVQRKLSLRLSSDKATLQLAVGPGRYILKPQAQTFPALPENEHVTMRLAELVGITTPPCALLRLKDDSLAYVVARFDRPRGGGKLRLEDFCQLAEKSPKQKYEGSAELCARIVKRFASEPLVELVKLFRLTAFSWWTGNGDMHLKNFSLLTGDDGLHRLAPAYDQLSTRLVIPSDDLALPVGGKKSNCNRSTWLEFAKYCGLPPKVAAKTLQRFIAVSADALALIARSFLNDEMKADYHELIVERTRILGAGDAQ
ncbi:MAG: type II toxin-antitoxin system HipA family toxin [Planctomycetota bacterium]